MDVSFIRFGNRLHKYLEITDYINGSVEIEISDYDTDARYIIECNEVKQLIAFLENIIKKEKI